MDASIGLLELPDERAAVVHQLPSPACDRPPIDPQTTQFDGTGSGVRQGLPVGLVVILLLAVATVLLVRAR